MQEPILGSPVNHLRMRVTAMRKQSTAKPFICDDINSYQVSPWTPSRSQSVLKRRFSTRPIYQSSWTERLTNDAGKTDTHFQYHYSLINLVKYRVVVEVLLHLRAGLLLVSIPNKTTVSLLLFHRKSLCLYGTTNTVINLLPPVTMSTPV